MKLSYTIPHIHVNLKDIKLPTQDTTSDIEINIGSANVHVEGDVSELVTYMKEAVAVVKDVTAWAVELPEMIDKAMNPGRFASEAKDESEFNKDGSNPFKD